MNPENACYIMLIALAVIVWKAKEWLFERDAERLHNHLLEQEIKGLKMDNEVLREYIQEMYNSEDVTLKYQLN